MKQSRLKFRVRSLLLLMTSIALTLGYLAMRAGRVVELQQHVESLGGSVTSKHDVRIDAEVEYVPDTAPLDVTRGSLPKGWLVEPVGIDLSWSDANDADVARIAKTEQLEGISLDGQLFNVFVSKEPTRIGFDLDEIGECIEERKKQT